MQVQVSPAAPSPSPAPHTECVFVREEDSNYSWRAFAAPARPKSAAAPVRGPIVMGIRLG